MSLHGTEKPNIPGVGRLTVVEATDGTGCVDPRKLVAVSAFQKTVVFRSETDYGEARSAGDMWGDVAALLRAAPTMPPEKGVQIITSAAADEGRPPSIHFDKHNYNLGNGPAGCGHYGNLISGKAEKAYGVKGQRMQRAVEYLFQMAEEIGLFISVAVLDGEHNEAGVLVVDSENETVIPEIDGKLFFRSDRLRHRQRAEKQAALATLNGFEVSAAALDEAHQQQTNVTLSIIAPGKPIYYVDLVSGNREVTFLGNVPGNPS